MTARAATMGDQRERPGFPGVPGRAWPVFGPLLACAVGTSHGRPGGRPAPGASTGPGSGR